MTYEQRQEALSAEELALLLYQLFAESDPEAHMSFEDKVDYDENEESKGSKTSTIDGNFNLTEISRQLLERLEERKTK